MTDELDVVRAPVPVGATAPPRARSHGDHPAVEARELLAGSITRPAIRTETRVRPPPDPLGVLDPLDPLDRPLTPNEPAPSRRSRVLVAVVAVVALVAGGLVVLAGGRDDDRASTGDDVVVMAASTVAPTTAPDAGVLFTGEVAWGPDPGVCPDGARACYTVAVELSQYEPGRQVDVECVVDDSLGPGPRAVTIGADGTASDRVPCAQDRGARSIEIRADGVAVAFVELPTTIVPRPTVSFVADRAVEDQPTCTDPSCRYLDVLLVGFEPGSQVDLSCVADGRAWASHPVLIGADGTATDGDCYFGYPGQEVWVEAGGVRSEALVWPG